MKINVKAALLGAALLIVNSPIVLAESELDWTPFLKTWENGCGDSKEWYDFASNTYHSDYATGNVTVGKIVLPEEYLNAVEAIEVTSKTTEMGVFKKVTIPVSKGSYYGIPVKSFEINFIPSSGIYDETVNFDATFEEAQMRLSGVEYQIKDGEHHFSQTRLLRNSDTGYSGISCWQQQK